MRRSLADVYAMQGAYGPALAEYAQVQALAEASGDRVNLGRTVGNVGIIYLEQGAYAAARTQFQQWLQIAQETGTGWGRAGRSRCWGACIRSRARTSRRWRATSSGCSFPRRSATSAM